MKTQFTVTTKKNTTTETKWDIVQERPYYCVERNNWSGRNDEAIRRKIYKCNLLRSDMETNFDNRKDFAGYEGNPGTITFRGNDLGEMSVILEKNRYNNEYSWDATICVRGYGNRATDSERAFVKAEIVPMLAKFIEANASELLQNAKQDYEKGLKKEIEYHREQLAKLEVKIPEMVELFGK